MKPTEVIERLGKLELVLGELADEASHAVDRPRDLEALRTRLNEIGGLLNQAVVLRNELVDDPADAMWLPVGLPPLQIRQGPIEHTPIVIADQEGTLLALHEDGRIELGDRRDLFGAIAALELPWQRTLAGALAGAAQPGPRRATPLRGGPSAPPVVTPSNKGA